MRLSSTIAGLAVLAAAVAAWAALPAAESPHPASQALRLTSTRTRHLELHTSPQGRPILSASDLVPGASASGRIVVSNTGNSALQLALVSRRHTRRLGPNGGELSEALRIRIIRRATRRKRSAGVVYAGSLSELSRLRLKPLAPGARQTYGFRASMLDGGLPATPTSGDNRFQGSAASVDFVWIATAAR